MPCGDEALDSLDVFIRCGRVAREHPLAHLGRRRFDLEQDVDGVADLGRRKPACPPRHSPVAVVRGEPDDSLRIEAVGAALEEGERTVGEPPDPMTRRSGRRDEIGKRRGHAHGAAFARREQLELRLSERIEVGLGLVPTPIDADEHPAFTPLELDRSSPPAAPHPVRRGPTGWVPGHHGGS